MYPSLSDLSATTKNFRDWLLTSMSDEGDLL